MYCSWEQDLNLGCLRDGLLCVNTFQIENRVGNVDKVDILGHLNLILLVKRQEFPFDLNRTKSFLWTFGSTKCQEG